jgi:hypothetical protein
MRVAFCIARVEGPNGPTLAPTTTKRRHTLDVDATTFATLIALADGFVFGDDGGATAWKSNRVTTTFSVTAGLQGCRAARVRLHDLRPFTATEMLHAGIRCPWAPPARSSTPVDHAQLLRPEPSLAPTAKPPTASTAPSSTLATHRAERDHCHRPRGAATSDARAAASGKNDSSPVRHLGR